MPKVSVVIPAYNAEKSIRAAIESVLGQNYTDYEVIVVDDGSTDSTAQVIKDFGGRLVYIHQENRGPAHARNAGVLTAKGEYIAFLDADDIWLQDKLGLQVDLLDRNENLGLTYTDMYLFDKPPFDQSARQTARYSSFEPPQRGKVLEKLFLGNFIPTTSVVMRKKCFDRVGLFNPALVPIEDYDRWLRVAANYEIDFVGKPLADHCNQGGIFGENNNTTFTNIINTLKGVIADYPYLKKSLDKKSGERLANLYLVLWEGYLDKRDFKKAFQSLGLAFSEASGAPVLFVNTVFSIIIRTSKLFFAGIKRRLLLR